MTEHRTGCHWALVGLLLPVLAVAGSYTTASQQPFPHATIRIVVPAAPSTPPDVIGRVIANELMSAEGWPVIVENRPSPGMMLAGSEVLKQPADGTSIFAMGMPLMAAPSLFPNMPFRVANDFAPLIRVTKSYNVLVVNPAVPARSVAELVALLKQKPDMLSYSSGGFGTPAHLIGEMFKLNAGVRATHVPYQQFPQAIADLISGANQYMFITMLPVIDLIQSGRLRALAVAGPERVPALRDIPTMAEQGYPDLVVEDWVGYAVKVGTPADTVTRLNRAINETLARHKVRDVLLKLGAMPVGGTPEEFGALVQAQLAHWAKVVNDAGIKIPQ